MILSNDEKYKIDPETAQKCKDSLKNDLLYDVRDQVVDPTTPDENEFVMLSIACKHGTINIQVLRPKLFVKNSNSAANTYLIKIDPDKEFFEAYKDMDFEKLPEVTQLFFSKYQPGTKDAQMHMWDNAIPSKYCNILNELPENSNSKKADIQAEIDKLSSMPEDDMITIELEI